MLFIIRTYLHGLLKCLYLCQHMCLLKRVALMYWRILLYLFYLLLLRYIGKWCKRLKGGYLSKWKVVERLSSIKPNNNAPHVPQSNKLASFTHTKGRAATSSNAVTIHITSIIASFFCRTYSELKVSTAGCVE